MIKLLSPGEIAKGQWIMVYECTQIERVQNPFTGQIDYVNVTVKNPWFKGIPYLVEDVAGPIIAVQTFYLQDVKVPIIFLDSRVVKFLEVEEQFGLNYIAQMTPKKEEVKIQTEEKKQ